MGGQKFKYVYIPADVHESIEQQELELEEGKEVEGFLDKLKAHFRVTSPAKTAEQWQQQKASLMQSLPAGSTIDPSLLDKTVGQGLNMVENIALLGNAKSNGFVGVNLYVDDEGAIKDLALNPRATEIACCCGKRIEVRGDAFIARVFDNGDDFQRLDFGLEEVSSSAAWVGQARETSRRKEREERPEQVWQQIKERSAGQSAHVQELSPAQSSKEDGNAAFKRGDYEQAVSHYTRALGLDPLLTAARNNRAMALINLQRYAEAEQDCSGVVELEPRNVKALFRRATARKEVGQVAGAIEDLQHTLKLDPKNIQAQQMLDALQSSMQQTES